MRGIYMTKPRIILADTDVNYLWSVQLKFIEEFYEKIDLEIISDRDYFEKLFELPQKADILIVSEELYQENIQKHNIGVVFILTEQYKNAEEQNVNYIYKYTSIKEIFNEIINKSGKVLSVEANTKVGSRIILVYSPAGGVGKTSVALGLCSSLQKNYKKVLYLDAECLQTFQHLLVNETSVSSSELYSKMARNQENLYQEIKPFIRNENFSYLPSLKAPLMSLGISVSVYLNIAVGAKKSMDYDFIVIDTDSVLDETKGKFLEVADKVIIVTTQKKASVYSMGRMLENVNGVNSEKYVFLCNDFCEENDNYLIAPQMKINFNINHYIKHFPENIAAKLERYAALPEVQKTALLLL